MKKKTKIIISLVLTVALIFGSLAGYFALTYQAKAVTNDLSGNNGNAESNNENNAGGGGEEPIAVLSSSVKVFAGDEERDINASIESVVSTENGVEIVFENGVSDKIKSLGVGDIFYLEGNEETPFKQTYIGKAAFIDKGSDKITLVTETPTIDEVFDKLHFNIEETMKSENIKDVYSAEGVTVRQVDSLDSVASEFKQINYSSSDGQPAINSLVSSNDASGKAERMDDSGNSASFVMELDVDLTKLIKMLKKDVMKLDSDEDDDSLNDNNEYKTALDEAIDSLNDNDEVKANLTGKFGIEDFKLTSNVDWDISYGFKDLAFGITGKNIFEGELDLCFADFELKGKTTSTDIINAVKLQGLDEKLIPLVFFNFMTMTPMTVTPGNVIDGLNNSIALTTAVSPITVGAMVYIDLYGNISVDAKFTFAYEDNFTNEVIFVKDGKWIADTKNENKKETNWAFELIAKIDADIHIGASGLLYIFNLNVVDIAVAKLGFEVEGKAAIKIGSDSNSEELSGYARLYLKLGDIKAKLKLKAELLFLEYSNQLKWDYTIADLTLWESGKKNDTRYNKDTMSYNSMTAGDEDYVYYKDTNGYLIRESKKDKYRLAISKVEFFKICGIDASYIYVLRPGEENERYDIYRIAKDGSTNKLVVSDARYCLLQDEIYMYYVPGFNSKDVERIDRNSLKSEVFASFDDDVEIMIQQGDNFHMVTRENDSFSWFFGSTNFNYLTDKNGKLLKDYGSDFKVEDYPKSDFNGYYNAVRYASNGYLRRTAYESYWMSKDKKNTVKAEGISGWNPKDCGILTTQNNDKEGAPYKIVLYRASDGQPQLVTEAESQQAFFTLCQDDNGYWYFFDQNSTSLILYKMNKDFTGKEAIKAFDLSEISYNLSTCSMEIMNSRLYFYTMPDSATSKVLYRYDLY